MALLDAVPEFVAQCSPQCVGLLSCLLTVQAHNRADLAVKEFICEAWPKCVAGVADFVPQCCCSMW